MRSQVEGTRLYNNLIMDKNRLAQAIQTLTGTFVMDSDMPPVLFLDPGGASRVVTLPAESTAEKGLHFYLVNTADADEDLTVQNDAAGAIGTVEQGTMGFFITNGTTWFDMTVPQELSALSGYTGSAAELNYLDIATLGTGAASKAVVLDTGEDYTWPATGVLTYGVLNDGTTQLNATAAELNGAADVSARYISIGDNTTYTALVANSGKVHTLPDLTGSCTITLPAVASGLEYKFVYAGVAADAQNWIIDTGADANFYLGGLAHLDTDAGSGGDEIVPIAGDGDSNSKLTVVTPDVGTEISMVCDGTSWVLSGMAVSATVPSFADQ